ncbi:hypothetical protein [Polymorphobacter fuscus]|uniref:hypothetical protein n=1 Tax=Sandarakinorhabdus fusca TaxID=1439888 RepID=UPI0016BCD76D|nr:hypothetical protein [Polymorphobacter fuscus]NJC09765.1 alpha-beta hydrolase superfamily lysophospholipase [Polymorphobacter fuscus]
MADMDFPAIAAEQWLHSASGLRIFTRHWPASGAARATLVLCHGVATIRTGWRG